MADGLDAIPRHEPVDVTKRVAEAAEPAPERITRPDNGAAVERIAKRETGPAES